MRILNVTPFGVLPTQVGGAVRIFNLMSRLARSHEVAGFSLVPGKPIWIRSQRSHRHESSYVDIQYAHPLSTIVSRFTRAAWVNSPVLSGAGLSVARSATLDTLLHWADIVMVEYPWQFEYIRKQSHGKPIVYASHNIEFEKFSSFATALGGRTRRNWLNAIGRMEANAVTRADRVLTVSRHDKVGLEQRYNPLEQRVIVIPDGANPHKYTPTTGDQRHQAKLALGLPDKPTVLFMGGSSALPNRIGAEWVRELATREGSFTFVSTGAAGSNIRHGNLVETGVVPEIAPYLHAVDAAVVPIQYGGGVKLKLLESLAAGVPTVVFPEALVGTSIEGPEHVLIAEKNSDSLLHELRSIIRNPKLATRLTQAGRRIIKSQYDWDTISVQLENVLDALRITHTRSDDSDS